MLLQVTSTFVRDTSIIFSRLPTHIQFSFIAKIGKTLGKIGIGKILSKIDACYKRHIW